MASGRSSRALGVRLSGRRLLAAPILDGAYDGDPAYRAAADRQHDPLPDVVIPPRASAVTSTDDLQLQNTRDRRVQLIAENGRTGWQRATGYGRRNQVETAIGRYKHLIGPRLRARTSTAQPGEATIGIAVLNRMLRVAKPVSVRRR